MSDITPPGDTSGNEPAGGDPSLPPAGWYPDPTAPGQQRYWDGSRWTDVTDRNYAEKTGQAPAAPTASPAQWPGSVPTPAGAGAYGVAKVDPWLWQSIVATILCCLPLGIAGIVFAAKSQSSMSAGDVAGATENARKARLFTLLAVGIGVVVVVIWAALFAFSTSTMFNLDNL